MPRLQNRLEAERRRLIKLRPGLCRRDDVGDPKLLLDAQLGYIDHLLWLCKPFGGLNCAIPPIYEGVPPLIKFYMENVRSWALAPKYTRPSVLWYQSGLWKRGFLWRLKYAWRWLKRKLNTK